MNKEPSPQAHYKRTWLWAIFRFTRHAQIPKATLKLNHQAHYEKGGQKGHLLIYKTWPDSRSEHQMTTFKPYRRPHYKRMWPKAAFRSTRHAQILKESTS